MTDPKAETSVPRPARHRRPLRAAGVAALAVILMIAVAVTALYLNRRFAARQALIGWLDQRGIPADVEVKRVEMDGFVGRIRIGDPANPDVTVERVEVDYVVGLPWSRGGLGVTPSRIRLVRPVLRASWRDGKLSVGSLDPLIKEFTGRPPRPDSRAPLVIVESGRLRLDTEYGPVEALGDARVDNGKLMRLQARLPAAALKSGDLSAVGLEGGVDLTTTGDRVTLQAALGARDFALDGMRGQGARLTLSGDLPYPDLKTRRGDGKARLDARLTADALTAGAETGREVDLAAAFDGVTAGWLESFRIEGASRAALTAGRLDGPVQARAFGAKATNGKLSLARDAEGLRWSLDAAAEVQATAFDSGGIATQGLSLRSQALSLGGRNAAFEASGPLAVGFRRFVFGDLVLRDGAGRARLDAVQDAGTRIEVDGGLTARGGWPLFGPVGAADAAELAAMKRALGDFRLAAPAIRFTTGTGGTRVALDRPAELRPVGGGRLTIAQAGDGVYLSEAGRLGGGALTLKSERGSGLPALDVSVPSWRLTEAGFEAQVDGRAELDFDIGRDIGVRTRGLLALANGRLTYVAADCLDFTVRHVELGENDVEQAGGRLCPQEAPLLTSMDGRWRVEGRFDQASALAPFLNMRFAEANGALRVDGAPSGLALEARVERAAVLDTLEPRRFHPLTAAAVARFADERWTGAFDISGAGRALARLTLQHDGRAERGGLAIAAPSITFAENGLQPSDLTPLVDGFVQSPVTGSVGFEGRIDWTADADAGSSRGRLTVPGLNFVTPAGPVEGLKGEVIFTSLAPLITAPDQRLTIDRLDTATDATAAELVFSLDAAAINVSGARVEAGGGTVSVEPLSVPLDPSQPFSGVVVLDRVQLGEVVSDSGFGDKVELDAVVSGRLPFTADPKTGVRVAGGSLAAVQPGRLSIRREALDQVDAGGGGDVPPGMVEDLAYQAMENLAFDVLSADVNSLEGGRMAVLFHIKGRHDPPQRQELRLTLPELISRRFLNRNLPLPSGTEIDLTLDTTLNLNQLIGDLLAINRARAGQAEDGP